MLGRRGLGEERGGEEGIRLPICSSPPVPPALRCSRQERNAGKGKGQRAQPGEGERCRALSSASSLGRVCHHHGHPPPTSGERWHGASTQQTRPAGCVELCRRGLSPAFSSHPGWGGHSLVHPKGWGPALQVHGEQSSLSPSRFLPSSLLEFDSDALCQPRPLGACPNLPAARYPTAAAVMDAGERIPIPPAPAASISTAAPAWTSDTGGLQGGCGDPVEPAPCATSMGQEP